MIDRLTQTTPMFAFEGCDGVGKSTIRSIVAEWISGQGLPVVEIGQHSWLDIIASRIIIDVRERRQTYSSEAIVHAYASDKRLHIERTALPNASTSIVLCDRSVISDLVYQHAIYGVAYHSTLDRMVRQSAMFPSVVVYVYADIEKALERIEGRSKHRRHYERECDLRIISSIYEEVFETLGMYIDCRIIRFDNNGCLDKHKIIDLAVEIMKIATSAQQ